MKYLIVDDHPLILRALTVELGGANECLLATSLQECLGLVEQHPDIDLIIYDLNLPDSHGMQGFMSLRTKTQAIPVLVLSGRVEKEEIKQLLNLGAAGFVPKTTSNNLLQCAIRTVLEGGIYLPAELIGLTGEGTIARPAPRTDANLTPRENEVLPLLALGLSNKQIAAKLGLSEYTVRVYVTHILKKMNLSKRAQVASRVFFSPK